MLEPEMGDTFSILIRKKLTHLWVSVLNSSSQWQYSVILIVAVMLLFAPINHAHSYIKLTDRQTDFRQHTLWAIELKDGGLNELPPYVIAHSGWQFLLVGINFLTGFSFKRAAFIAALMSIAAFTLILICWFWPALKKLPWWKGYGIILGLNLATPISLLYFGDKLMYLGYIGIISYHNPTIILLRPFALLQFILAYQCFQQGSFSNWKTTGAALISLLATFIKPSFAICLLPALGIVTLFRLFQKKHINFPALLLGQVLPTTAMLVWQFMLTYHSDGSGNILFNPMGVVGAYSGFLPAKFVLSLFFPLMVIILYARKAIFDIRLVLAWVVLIPGAFFTCFLAENGARILDVNFGWSGEIALLILFVTSTLFYMELPQKAGIKRIIAQSAFALHVLFGIGYYFFCLFNKSYF